MHPESTIATRAARPYPPVTAVRDAVLTVGPDDASIDRLRGVLTALVADLRPAAGSAHDADLTHRTVLQAAPRLAKAVADHLVERERLAAAVDEFLAQLTDTDPSATRIGDLRSRGKALVARLARYRQRHSDLLHEVDAADLGGEG